MERERGFVVCFLSMVMAPRYKLAPPELWSPGHALPDPAPAWYTLLSGDRFWYGWDYFMESRVLSVSVGVIVVSLLLSGVLFFTRGHALLAAKAAR